MSRDGYDGTVIVVLDVALNHARYLVDIYGDEFVDNNILDYAPFVDYDILDGFITKNLKDGEDILLFNSVDSADVYKRDTRTKIIYDLKRYETAHNVKLFKKCLLFVYGSNLMTSSWQIEAINNFETPWYTEGWNKIEIQRYCSDNKPKKLYNADNLIKSCNDVYPLDNETQFSLGEHLHKCAVAGNSMGIPSASVPLLLHDIGKLYCEPVHNEDGSVYYPNYENRSAYESLFYFADFGNDENNTMSLYFALLIEFLPKFRFLEQNGFDVKKFVTSPFYSDLVQMEKIEKMCR